MQPKRLQLGTSRLEFLPDIALRVFLDKSWIHFGDAPESHASWLRRTVRRARLDLRGLHDVDGLYAKTNFEPFYFEKGRRLPFENGALTFILSEHFFEHLFFDEALDLFRECRRVLAPTGMMRVSVPDADLRTYEAPEAVGFPKLSMPFSHPNKHKTRWNVYLLAEALSWTGFEAHPVRFCTKDRQYVRGSGAAYPGVAEQALATDLSYLRRQDSLIVDALPI